MPSWAVQPPAEDPGPDKACVLRSIELEDGQLQTKLRLGTDGRPSSIGARVEPGEGVVLDLTGCTSAADLSGVESSEGLVSAVQIDHGSAVQGDPMAVMIKIRGAFEYSVSSQPGTVLVSLKAENGAGASDQRVRVLEPLSTPSPPAAPPLLAPLPSGTPVTAPSLPENPLPASPPVPVPPAQIFEVAAAVESWAQAWTDQRVDDYLSAYALDFQPPLGLSRSVWEAQRRLRVARPQWIEVAIEALEVRLVEPGRALVEFSQDYSSDTYSDRVEKTLTLTLQDGSWRILREESGSSANLTGISRAEGLPIGAAPEAEAVDSGGRDSEAGSPPVEPEVAAIVEAARISVDRAPAYDASYQFISYPGGDPGWEIGSGSDVIIRAYRQLGVDLQERIHQDILADGAAYGIREPDPRIDHRRIRNLRVFLRRHGDELGVDRSADWRPGDIVFWSIDGKQRPNHLGIVSDRRSPDGQFLVIHHNEGGPPREEDVLFTWAVRGHFRWLPGQ